MKTITILLLLMLVTPSFAQDAPSCPDRGSDPDTFCPPGMSWSEESQQCIGMV